jgi:hypothetical protein
MKIGVILAAGLLGLVLSFSQAEHMLVKFDGGIGVDPVSNAQGMDPCGLPTIPRAAQRFTSHCQPRSRRTPNLPAALTRQRSTSSARTSTRRSGLGRARLTNDPSPASCSHTLRRRGLRGPIRPFLKSIPTRRTKAEMETL